MHTEITSENQKGEIILMDVLIVSTKATPLQNRINYEASKQVYGWQSYM